MASFSNTHCHDDTCVSELVNLDHDAIIRINIRMTLFLTCISVDLSTCLSVMLYSLHECLKFPFLKLWIFYWLLYVSCNFSDETVHYKLYTLWLLSALAGPTPPTQMTTTTYSIFKH